MTDHSLIIAQAHTPHGFNPSSKGTFFFPFTDTDFMLKMKSQILKAGTHGH